MVARLRAPRQDVDMRRSGRLTLVSGGAIGILGLLTACDQFQADPLVFTRVGDTTVVRVCLDLTVTKIEIEEADGDSQHAVGLWSADGSAYLPAGTEFAFSSPPTGLEPAEPFSEVLLDDDVYVRLAVSHVEGGSWRTFTPIDSGSLTEGVWLDGWGEPTSVPCTQEPCAPGWACHNDWPDPSGRPTELEPTYTPKPEP
jgi:hypothetical protein